MWSPNYDTQILYGCSVIRVDHAMPCRLTVYQVRQTGYNKYIFNRIEKHSKQTNTTKSEKKPTNSPEGDVADKTKPMSLTNVCTMTGV